MASAGVPGIADDLARDTDLSRLMQDLPQADDLLDSDAQAPVVADKIRDLLASFA